MEAGQAALFDAASFEAVADRALLSAGVAEREAAVAALGASADLRAELEAGSPPSQRTLLSVLKAAGVSRVGTRHKAASALLAELSSPAAVNPMAAGCAHPSLATAGPLAAGGGLGDDFWAQVSHAACAATDATGLPACPSFGSCP